jgi:hypothetical protein
MRIGSDTVTSVYAGQAANLQLGRALLIALKLS